MRVGGFPQTDRDGWRGRGADSHPCGRHQVGLPLLVIGSDHPHRRGDDGGFGAQRDFFTDCAVAGRIHLRAARLCRHAATAVATDRHPVGKERGQPGPGHRHRHQYPDPTQTSVHGTPPGEFLQNHQYYSKSLPLHTDNRRGGNNRVDGRSRTHRHAPSSAWPRAARAHSGANAGRVQFITCRTDGS